MARRPDRGAAGSSFQGDQGRTQPTSTEEEIARRGELWRHGHAPMQLIAVGLHAQECLCIHGGAPYWRRSARRQPGRPRGRPTCNRGLGVIHTSAQRADLADPTGPPPTPTPSKGSVAAGRLRPPCSTPSRSSSGWSSSTTSWAWRPSSRSPRPVNRAACGTAPGTLVDFSVPCALADHHVARQRRSVEQPLRRGFD